MMKLSANRQRLLSIISGGILFVVALCLPEGTARLVLFILALAAAGAMVLLQAGRNIAHGQIFDENFLMSLAAICAFILGEYAEGTAVMLFYQIGEYCQSLAVNRSRRSIAELMDIRPDHANVLRDGKIEQVEPDEVRCGEIIVIKPGERVPLDAEIIEGSSALDMSALSGESLPLEVAAGDTLLSGAVNLNGLLQARVVREFEQSTASRILELVENAGAKKARTEHFITRFAHYYTPAVVIIAVALALLPPLLFPGQQFSEWIYRGLVFLVISCPCALVISIPLSFFGGIGGASRRGILVKGGNYLEALADSSTVVFDKTGTLTRGVFKVQQLVPQQLEPRQLLRLAAYAESASSHPVALSLLEAFNEPIDSSLIGSVVEEAGYGVKAQIEGQQVLVGNAKLLRREGVSLPQLPPPNGTVVYLAVDGVYAGYIVIADELKADAAAAIKRLKQLGVRKTVMLTGDNEAIAAEVAAAVGVDEYHAGLLPADKVEQVEQLLAEQQQGKLVFVGDGINDAPVLARADIGVAMGALGSDAAIEAADIVIMTDEPARLAEAIAISRRTRTVVRQNIVFALGVKLLVLILGACGLVGMWAAVFADVGVALLAILNAMRILRRPLPHSQLWQ